MVRQREVIGSLPAYRQGATPDDPSVFKLSSNENPYPPLASVTASLTEAIGHIHLYPAISAPEISQRVAELHGVGIENLSFGSGSVEVASQLIHALAGAGDQVIFAWRSFEAYPSLVTIAGATPVPVALTADDKHDLDAMADAVTAATRLVFVCNPNNPTGTGVTRAELESFMARVPSDILVVIDEAYVHFNRDPETAVGVDFFRRYPNVAVLHTFSKAYGLAGLRIGYAIASPEVAADLRRVAVPFGVSDLAQRAAVASLDAEAELGERIDIIVAERERVAAAMREQGWPLEDSHANFIWLRTGAETDRLTEALTDAGVLVRAWSGEGLRITIGTPEANDRVVATTAAAASAPHNARS